MVKALFIALPAVVLRYGGLKVPYLVCSAASRREHHGQSITMYSPPNKQAGYRVLRTRSASCCQPDDRAKFLLCCRSSPSIYKALSMPFFPPLRNTRTRLKGGNSEKRMANSRRPARRVSYSGAGARRHMDWVRELDRALGGRSGIPCSNTPSSRDTSSDHRPIISQIRP